VYASKFPAFTGYIYFYCWSLLLLLIAFVCRDVIVAVTKADGDD